MPDCECTFVPPIEIRSFTGPTETQVNCDVNSHPDFKHLLYVKNHRAYEQEIYVKATILHPYLVRFGDCPAYTLPDKGHITDHSWAGYVVLPKDDDWTFGVFLFSDAKGGNTQEIDIYVATQDAEDSVPRPYSKTIKVKA